MLKLGHKLNCLLLTQVRFIVSHDIDHHKTRFFQGNFTNFVILEDNV